VRRVTVEAITTATSTPMVIGKLPVPSSTSSTIVTGAPMIAAAVAPMPTSMKAIFCASREGTMKAIASTSIAPRRTPRKSEEENMPPRRPAPSEIAEATSLPSSSAETSRKVRECSSWYWIAPWPEPRICGEPSAMRLSSAPPTAGRTQIGSQRSAHSAQVTARMVRIAKPAALIPTIAKRR